MNGDGAGLRSGVVMTRNGGRIGSQGKVRCSDNGKIDCCVGEYR